MKNKENKERFYRSKYCSMLTAGTFTMAIIYLMLLCDNIVAGFFIGTDGVAAVNIASPLIGIATSASICVSIGVSILYTRNIGAMDRENADKIYGMGLCVSGALSVLIMLLLFLFKDLYFMSTGAGGEILRLAKEYYTFLPLNAAVLMMSSYIEQMVYSDGDEMLESLSYVAQIGGNILLSILLAKNLGIKGIMLGTLIGNVLALLILLTHFLKKSNTLHFVPYFNLKKLFECIKYSITDGITYLLWGMVNYVIITYISRCYGEKYLVVLAAAVSLIEFSVIFDGIGMAIQPLIGVYYGEKNQLLIRRLMKDAIFTAIIEGIAASVLIFIFAAPFSRLFGIRDGVMQGPAVTAIRIMSVTLVASSLFMLETSYYLYIDHIETSVGAILIKDGVLYMLLPILCSRVFGVNGIWIGFALAPVLGIIISMAVIRLRVGKECFPDMLQDMKNEIVVYDSVLSKENAVEISKNVINCMKEHGYDNGISMKAGLFVEELSATFMEKNSGKKVLVEYSLLFDEASVRLIIRDTGEIFDITDSELKINGLSSFVINGLLRAHEDKDYVPTTGYNRNIIRFYKSER